MVLDAIKQLLSTLKRNKILTLIITLTWIVIVASFGVFGGMKNRPATIIVNPDDYNIKLKKNIEKFEEEYNRGQLLSSENNLTIFEINQSKNYYEKRKKLKGDN